MYIYGIAAMTPTRIIGRADGKMPWHIPEDFSIFKQVTMGHTLIMGRKTFESIGKPLPGRTTIILTSDINYKVDGATVVNSIEDIWATAEERTFEQSQEGADIPHMIVCGGGNVYEQLLPMMSHIHVSTIYQPVPAQSGDVLFPEFQDAFPEYMFKKRYPNFEYGIYIRDRGQEIPTPDIKYPFTPPKNADKKPKLVLASV